jgi:tetratricopeptide (TPR) repeat protein
VVLRLFALLLVGLGVTATPMLTAQSRLLEPAVPHERNIQPGDQHAYTFSLAAGQCARLELRSTGVALAVALRQPGQATEVVVIDDATDEDAPQPLTIVAPADGEYSLELRLSDGVKPGSYGLSLEAPRAATETDRQQVQAETLFREGLRLYNQATRESRTSAADRLRRAGEMFHALDNRSMEAKAIDTMGQTYNRLGESRSALEAYQRVLGLFRALGQQGNEASTLNNIALERIYQGEYAQAIEPLTKAAAMFEQIGDRWTMRSPINNLGMAYHAMGDVEKSGGQYRRALEIAQSNFDESGEAYAYMGLAALSQLQGKVQDTLNYYGRAIERYRHLNNHTLVALALSNMGSTQLSLGDPQSALDYLLRAQEVRKLAPNRLNEANTFGLIASALLGRLHAGRRVEVVDCGCFPVWR